MQRTWYRAEMTAGPETFCVFGSSVQPEKDMVESLQAGVLVLLEDLVFYDEEGVARSWSEWDPHCQPRMYLNPKFLISLMPMVGDPRNMGKGDKVLNLPHFMRDPS